MAQVGQIENRQPKKLEEGIGCGSVAVFEFDGVGDDLPVGPGQAAVGHGAVNEAVVILTSLEKDSGRKQERIGYGIDTGAAARVQSLRPAHVVKARGVHVEPHVAMRGVYEHTIGAAGELQMAVSFKYRGGLVIDHLVCAENVVAVVDHHVAVQGEHVSHPRLAIRVQLDGHSGRGYRLRNSDGENLLTGVVREWRGCIVRGVGSDAGRAQLGRR